MNILERKVFRKLSTPTGYRRAEILADFKYCCLSRNISRSIRREVLTGRAKFGIESSGKEVLQVAMARAFQKGDFFSGYYRDMTFMIAKELATPETLYASLYADTENDIYSSGRQMNNHFSTPLVDSEGNFTNHKDSYNVASALSPVAGQVTHALGIALASKAYQSNLALKNSTSFSKNGQEVSFCTIGDASTSEGVFFEAINAAGVMKVPLAIVVQDDGYGISVPTKYQTTKGSISEALQGFKVNQKGEGIDIYTLKAWDYQELRETFEKAIAKMRKTHIPAVFHVEECTQPLGHSTSGSHERYKSEERLQWEKDMDCNVWFERWILEHGIATQEELDAIKAEVKQLEKQGRKVAWKRAQAPVKQAKAEVEAIYTQILRQTKKRREAQQIQYKLNEMMSPTWSEIIKNAYEMQVTLLGEQHESLQQLEQWLAKAEAKGKATYETHLYSETPKAALKVKGVPAQYADDAPMKNGYEILNTFFDKALSQNKNLYAFGEDVGKIGDVNQAFSGMQLKYGEERVFDTGIREWTIVGQAIGMAMRGLRPIAEIQYLDYLAYAFSPLSDGLATLRYRTNGQQAAPAIIRTRGHRLEGVWHSGSPMGMMINSMRGIYLLTPRNMTQAAGMYNTMLQSDDPAIIVECLNGYRLKEKMPSNLDEFTVPIGQPEILKHGTDVTLVTYGSCVRIAAEAIQLLEQKGISVELIDVQSLLPFDVNSSIVESLKQTNRIVFLDEDVPGGATAFMMQQVLEKQKGYRYLDSEPVTITAKAYRPPFGDDGDYFNKPNVMDVFKGVLNLMREAEPNRF